MKQQKRKKSIDINKLSMEEMNQISDKLGEDVRKLYDQACEKANKLLNAYGMKSQHQISISSLDSKAPKTDMAAQDEAANL